MATGNNSLYLLGNNSQAIQSTGSPLPLVLTSFTAAKAGEKVELKWTTASEENTSSFKILRSLDGVNFNIIGTVKAAGNSSSTMQYDFTDNQPVGSTLYYKLKMVDKDDRYTYSPVATVNFTRQSKLLVRPNPASSVITVDAQNIATIEVLSLEGRVLIKKVAEGPQTNIQVQHLARGVYLVRLTGKDLQTKTERLVLR